MPIRPRAFAELTRLCARQDIAKHLVTHLKHKRLNVRVVADVHDLSKSPAQA